MLLTRGLTYSLSTAVRTSRAHSLSVHERRLTGHHELLIRLLILKKLEPPCAVWEVTSGSVLGGKDCGLAIRGVPVGPSGTSRSPGLCQDVCRSESTNRRFVAFAPALDQESPPPTPSTTPPRPHDASRSPGAFGCS